MKKIIVIDDEERIAATISDTLKNEGYNVVAFTGGEAAMRVINVVDDIDLILTDIRMPGVDGIEVLNFVRGLKRPIPVIVFTGHGDVETAVEIMKQGASDFLSKPVSSEELLVRVNKVLEKRQLVSEVESLRKKVEASESFHKIVGKSKGIQEVYELIEAVAGNDATVLIRGETGTGKEMVARAIHAAGSRKDEPFVAISCSALQQTLLESELFGHEKGSFTGAQGQKIGKLESAGKGTVLLDEIGDTPPDVQIKLLRVLEEREFERVGGLKPIKLNARILAATNRDLEEAIADGRFREDLYYRLNVIQMDIPPLRERQEDIVLLANYFLEFFSNRHDRPIDGFTPGAVEQLIRCDWPGNVRELKNVMERTVLTTSRRWIDGLSGFEGTRQRRTGESKADLPKREPYAVARDNLLDELEKAYLHHYMTEEKGRAAAVAEKMGVNVRTVNRMIKKHGLDRVDFKETLSVKEALS